MKKALWRRTVIGAALVVSTAGLATAQPREPHRYLKTAIGLSDAEIAQAERGQAIVKDLDTPLKREVAVFGIV